ncbi:MAG: hypothetical protein A2831_01420 [Candidatus Yanofskybacteria bacterium RIFCSPHIGHO2_01_FULL_44_17]|uniref:Transglycosylase SLT domain-containing protein n=1 Tax=Candidatus Yanofskybacteria bacterium RIFCSPHIGHO2_01_FULL_44_17 TaxID=1802668 RepID=A0A1F8EYG1_9BACT|nr:MAG: hypothetical protein A2831_01420 [Candidatus Yanofskybacteria bacterium RIFCSPHIGHO2_01_FULL_44_17]
MLSCVLLRNLFLPYLLWATLSAALAGTAYGQEPDYSKKETCQYEPACNSLLVEIENGKKELGSLTLAHQPKALKYANVIKRSDGIEIRRTITDFSWKEVGLKLLNLDTGSTRIVKILKQGARLINTDPDFTIGFENRPAGLMWNDWNTAFTVKDVKDGGKWVVILNKFPRRLKSGKREDVIYSPYSTDLHTSELVNSGLAYLRSKTSDSIIELWLTKKIWPDSVAMNPLESELDLGGNLDLKGFIERLALIEQVDPFEFYEFRRGAWPYNPNERMLVILAINKESAYSITSSPASASGIMQFTLGTWNLMRQAYPWARLPAFEAGTRNHEESIKAAALLQNYNLKMLKSALGPEVVKDPDIEHFLAAGYNGGITPVIKAIKQAKKEKTGWRQELRKLKKTSESIDYLDKLDYLL